MNDYQDNRNNKILKKIVEKLDLRFPVAEISKKMKVSKGNVSNYLNNNKPVSDNFITTLLDMYELENDFNSITPSAKLVDEIKDLKEKHKALRLDLLKTVTMVLELKDKISQMEIKELRGKQS